MSGNESAAVERVAQGLYTSGHTTGLQYAATRLGARGIEVSVGKADADTGGRPVTQDTVFLSCSCTKVVTAILALQLADEGRLSLDLPLGEKLDETPYSPAITLRQLLTHTSGLANPPPLTWVHTEADHAAFDESKAFHRCVAKSPRLASAPGARYRYSNIGYWIVGRILERISGSTYADLVASRIAARLGLEPHALSCGFPPAVRAARGHFPRRSLSTLIVGALAPRWIWDTPAREWRRCVPLTMNGAAYGGIFATAAGYLAVLKDLLETRPVLLSAGARDELLRPQQTADGENLHVTLGFRIGACNGQRYLSKPGGGPGFSGDIRVYPEIGLATAWLRNTFAFDEKAICRISDRLDEPILTAPRYGDRAQII